MQIFRSSIKFSSDVEKHVFTSNLWTTYSQDCLDQWNGLEFLMLYSYLWETFKFKLSPDGSKEALDGSVKKSSVCRFKSLTLISTDTEKKQWKKVKQKQKVFSTSHSWVGLALRWTDRAEGDGQTETSLSFKSQQILVLSVKKTVVNNKTSPNTY